MGKVGTLGKVGKLVNRYIESRKFNKCRKSYRSKNIKSRKSKKKHSIDRKSGKSKTIGY